MSLLTHDTNMDSLGVDPDHERGAFMSTFTGGKFYPLDPHPEDIHIEDIAHALSQNNRFNGHLRWPYSVAQHSVNVMKLVKRTMTDDHDILLFALLHDAAEAYIGDIIRPVKLYLPQFKEIENRIMEGVAERFGFEMTEGAESIVKTADNLMCAAEKRDLHPTRIEWLGMSCPSKEDIPTITPWTHSYAKSRFMMAFNELQ